MENINEKLIKEIESEWEISEFGKILTKDFPDKEFIVSGLIPTNAISCIASSPGFGKSWIILELVLAVSEGRPFLNMFKTKRKNCWIVDEERTAQETQRRLKLLGIAENNKVFISNLQGVRIDIPEHIERIIEICKEKEIGLVVFDSLRAVNSLDENSSMEAQKILNCFKRITKENISCVLTHHNRKLGILTPKDPESILRGSTGLLAGISSLISLNKSENLGKRIEMTISQPKFNEGEKTQEFKVALQEEEEGKMKWEFMNFIEEEFSKVEQVKSAILEILDAEGKKNNQELSNILMAQGFKVPTIRRAIEKLEESKEIFASKEGRKKYFDKVK